MGHPVGGELELLEDTLDERGKAARDGAGWHTCLDALETSLDGRPDAREGRPATCVDGWRA